MMYLLFVKVMGFSTYSILGSSENTDLMVTYTLCHWACSLSNIHLLLFTLNLSFSLCFLISVCHGCLTRWLSFIHLNLTAPTLSVGIRIFFCQPQMDCKYDDMVPTLLWIPLLSPRSLLLSTFPLCTVCSCRLELAFGSWISLVL